MERIYLDHAATSPVHPDVVQEMMPYFTEVFGNPSSIHHIGRQARHAVDEARNIIATSIGARENEIIFTSGGTESDNLAIVGTAFALKQKGNHIITTAIEHHAVLKTCQYLERLGFEVSYLPVDENGLISVEELKRTVKDETILVSIMYGNNEVGTIQPIQKIGQFLQEKGIVFHTDAVQAYGTIALDVNDLHVDLLSVSSHKINGPKGIGFLYVRSGVQLYPRLIGGEQERKRRAGTENVAGIVGLKQAILISRESARMKVEEYSRFKELMITILTEEGIHFAVNGAGAETLPHVLNLYFPGTNVESMLVNLDLAGIAVSSGSACTAGSIDPSHVLTAMYGSDSDKAASSIRFSFGYGNNEEQIVKAARETAKIVKRLVK